MGPKSILAWLGLGVLLMTAGSAAGAEALPLSELAKPGRLLMLRHALAPGIGDPENFRLDDCSTQRNLDDVGRAQARNLGMRLAQAGVKRARVISSQWCRCLETAKLLNLGPVEAHAALNSFYPQPRQRTARIEALQSLLSELPGDGQPVVLVTHQFTINALTDGPTPSGGGSLFQLNGSGKPQLLGSIQAN